MHLISRFTAAALFAGTVLALPSLRADTLFWNNVTYSPGPGGATTKTDVGTVNGNTVSVQFSGGSYFNNNTAAEPSPAVGAYNSGTTPIYADGGTGSKALQIYADFDNAAGNIIAGASITVTVFFSQPVSNLMFSFYDVDGIGGSAPFTDYINNISGTSLLGTTVAPTSLTPSAGYNTATLGATGSFTGGSTNSAQNTNNANAGVAFGSTPITQLTFTYTDTAATPGGAAHSVQQIIALGDLTFTTVPEPSAWAFCGAAGLAGIWTLRRRTHRTA